MPSRNAISDLISILGDGDFDAKATRELDKVVEAVEAGHGSGKIVISIGLKKEGRKLVLKPTVKATVPVPPVDSSMFFVSKEGRLTDEDPAQLVIKEAQGRPKRLVDLDDERKKREAQTAPATDTKKEN
jgi:hypothetical protein